MDVNKLNKRTIQYEFVSKYLFYLLLIFIIILPYVKNYGLYLIGGDLGILENSIDVDIERSFYLWSDYDGSGGLAIGKFSNIIHLNIIKLLLIVFNPPLVQIIIFVLFYSLGFWGTYILIKKFANKYDFKLNSLLLTAVSFFYFTNLLTNGFLNTGLYFFLSYISLTPLLIYTAWEFIDTNKKKYLMFFTLISFLNFPTFNNITLAIIQYFTIFVFLFLFSSKKSKNIICMIILFSLLNIGSIFEYFLLYFYSKDLLLNSSINQYLLNVATSVQTSEYSLEKLFSFFAGNLFGQWWNYQGLVDNFYYKNLYSTILYKLILFIPIFTILISFIKKDSKKKSYIEIYLLSLFLIFLVPLSLFGFKPLLNLFDNLFVSLPILGIFRNSQKFLLPVILTACFLLYISISNSNKKILSFCFIGFLLILNVYSFTGYFLNYYTFGEVTDNYKNIDIDLNKLGIDNSSKCMIYPASDFILFGFKWNYVGYSPFLVAQNQIPCFHKNGEIISAANKFIYSKFINIENVNKNDWQKYNIKYVIFHNDINYNVFNQPDYSIIIKNYLDTNFKLIDSNNNFNIYQTYNEKISLLNSQNLSFEKVNPTKYKIIIKNLKKSQDLSFLKSFHSEWKLYLEKYPASPCNKTGEYSIDLYSMNLSKNDWNGKMVECFHERKFFEGEELSYLWEKTVFDSTHKVVNEYANGWTIDPEYIKANYPYEYYRRYIDGSIDIELTLYFKPQSYFYLGAIISILTFVGCIGYLAWDWRRKRNGQG